MRTSQQDQQITLLFHQATIANVFADLLEAMGYDTRLAKSEEELSAAGRIITEPLYYDGLTIEQQSKSLVICDNHQEKDISGHVISRPLTSSKIEHGLRSFLEVMPVH